MWGQIQRLGGVPSLPRAKLYLRMPMKGTERKQYDEGQAELRPLPPMTAEGLSPPTLLPPMLTCTCRRQARQRQRYDERQAAQCRRHDSLVAGFEGAGHER